MFKRHASPEFRSLGLGHVVPRRPEAVHANDNLRGLRRPAGQRRSPPPRLARHWVLVGESRLECRWQVEGSCEAASIEARDFTQQSSNCLIWNTPAGAVCGMAGSGPPPRAPANRVGISP